MGYYDRRINKAVKTAGIIDGSEQARIVFFSDCHRGDGSWSDSFLHNKILYQALLLDKRFHICGGGRRR